MNVSYLFRWLGTLNPFLYTAKKCGHRTERDGPVSAFGQTITLKMPTNEDGSVDYCLDCIGKMTIRCAWCGESIFIGQPITLETPDPNSEIPDYAVPYDKDSSRLIGCLLLGCPRAAGFNRAGFWLPGEGGRGYVYRVPTPLEIAFGRMAAGDGNSMLIVNNLSSIEEAVNPNVVASGIQKPR